MQDWNRQFAERTAIFAPLRPLTEVIEGAGWPTLDQLNAMASAAAVVSGGGQPLRFSDLSGVSGAADYEQRIHDSGVVPLREANWHDLFNALVWLTFPLTKAALNRAHVEALREQPGTLRGRRRDALTLFDESGVVVLSNSRAVLEGIRGFDWKRVLWDERVALLATTKIMIFGHALYEKALSPYVGMTGHALLLQLPVDTITLESSASSAQADALAASALRASVMQPRDLSPLPVLGVPGWWEANGDASFYNNASYFRAGRSGNGARG